MNFARFTASLLLASLLFCGAGCYMDDPDALKDWKGLGEVRDGRFDKWITDEYKSYIETLPAREKKFAKDEDACDILEVGYFEDGHGQHAIHIELPVDGTYWHHVLFYDKSNKRIKVIVYKLGHYSC